MNKTRKLAKYLFKKMCEVNAGLQFMSGSHFDAEDVEFWINQQKIKSGHSEWSERFKRNIWIEDDK